MATIEERIKKLEEELKQLKSDAMASARLSDLLTIEEALKLPINTPILVTDNLERGGWIPVHFAGVSSPGTITAFVDGGTSYSSDDAELTTEAWGFAKRDYTAPSIINWIPNTGTKPTLKAGQTGVGRRRDGMIILNLDRWTLEDQVNDIIEYFIVE